MTINAASILEIPLGTTAHDLAGKFATEHPDPQTSKQIYLNTLAVYAVHRYFTWLDIDSHPNRSDSWNPALRNHLNVADLQIADIGKLECCPILPGQARFSIPTPAREDRLGYIAVQFNEQLDCVQLLGFAPASNVALAPAQLLLDKLQPLDALLAHLERQSSALPPFVQDVINVGRWFSNEIAQWGLNEGWIPLSGPALAMRDSSTEHEFESIAYKLRQDNGIRIPLRGSSAACQTIQLGQNRLKLYVATWRYVDNTEEWPLLLVLKAARGTALSHTVKLTVSDPIAVMTEGVLEPDTKQPYLVAQVAGTSDEQLQVKIAIEENGEAISCSFKFSSELPC